MSLFQAALFTSLGLLLVSSLLIWNGPAVGAMARAFPRSNRAAWVTMGFGAAWTLYRVTQLGEAEFGNYRNIIFICFAVLAVLSFRYAPDFLSVRGSCILVLLVANVLLSASYMKYGLPAHLVLNCFAYLMIALALYLAVSPFRVRDFVKWLFVRPNRVRILGAIIGLYGFLLMGTAFGSQ